MAIFFVDSFFASDLFTLKKSCDIKCCVPDAIDIFEIVIIFFLNVKLVNKRNYLINICFTLTNLWSSVFEMVPSLEKNEVYCNSCKQYMFEVTPTSRIKKTQVTLKHPWYCCMWGTIKKILYPVANPVIHRKHWFINQ